MQQLGIRAREFSYLSHREKSDRLGDAKHHPVRSG
jgi:hypothetical protein